MIFLNGQYGSSIVAVDSTTLETIGTLATGMGGGRTELIVHKDGRSMLVPLHRQIALRDIRSKAWGPVLNFPANAYGPSSLQFSDDGRTVLAVFQSNVSGGLAAGGTAGGPQFAFLLGVWRLPEPPADEAPAGSEGTPAMK